MSGKPEITVGISPSITISIVRRSKWLLTTWGDCRRAKKAQNPSTPSFLTLQNARSITPIVQLEPPSFGLAPGQHTDIAGRGPSKCEQWECGIIHWTGQTDTPEAAREASKASLYLGTG